MQSVKYFYVKYTAKKQPDKPHKEYLLPNIINTGKRIRKISDLYDYIGVIQSRNPVTANYLESYTIIPKHDKPNL